MKNVSQIKSLRSSSLTPTGNCWNYEDAGYHSYLQKSSKDEVLKSSALNTALNGVCGRYGLIISGQINNAASIRIMDDSGIFNLLQGFGLPRLDWIGIHSFTFIDTALGRRSMTLDLYLNYFVPSLCTRLRVRLKCPYNLLTVMHSALAKLMFVKGACTVRDRILTTYTLWNREFYTKHSTTA
ncbi:unnamed protein product [Protopolystoma xenopodis]|uniref:Uncharacterized protein n=1 Tax=Protopolystoma xenopodis TaxID=117903 RepID=A0A448WW53_9PLAT|nr:unnamed protein product [Protopolystoma xenopodis]